MTGTRKSLIFSSVLSCSAVFSFSALFSFGCDSKDSKPAEAPVSTAGLQAAPPTELPKTPGSQKAALGQPAPDFTLSDLDGKEVKLSDHRGKTVVLEWFNPECPFVKLSHGKGSLKGLAESHLKNGVVWLAINSGGPGRQGHGLDKNRAAQKDFGLSHPILLDEDGSVGKSYGATNTPHLFIIDAQGVLVYRGAIDNSPDGEGATPTGGTLINYVTLALAELGAGKPLSTPETKAYGCSVKYSDP
jgi:peroxiredoxin